MSSATVVGVLGDNDAIAGRAITNIAISIICLSTFIKLFYFLCFFVMGILRLYTFYKVIHCFIYFVPRKRYNFTYNLADVTLFNINNVKIGGGKTEINKCVLLAGVC